MEAIELRKKTTVELNEMLHSLLEEQFKLRMHRGISETPKTHELGVVRKNIARVKTILRELTHD